MQLDSLLLGRLSRNGSSPITFPPSMVIQLETNPYLHNIQEKLLHMDTFGTSLEALTFRPDWKSRKCMEITFRSNSRITHIPVKFILLILTESLLECFQLLLFIMFLLCCIQKYKNINQKQKELVS